MTTDTDSLEEAIEALLLHGPAPSRYLAYLDLHDVTATFGPGASPSQNRVGLARFDADRAVERVRTVLTAYRRAGRGLRWYVSPRSRPRELGDLLRAAGLRLDPDSALAGMACTDLPEAVHEEGAGIEIVSLRELRGHADLLAESSGSAGGEVEGMLDMLEAGAAPGYAFLSYLAYAGGVPVAFANAVLDRSRGVLLLAGAATLPAHRRRGLYGALVRARLADARARGCHAVVVQARRATSAPLLPRYGFRELLPIEAYVLD